MPSALNNAGVFLVNTIFDLLIFIFLIRLILVSIHADYFNPVSQFIIKCTKFIINPLKRILPNIKRIELASIFCIIFLECLKFSLLGLLVSSAPSILGLIVLASADALRSLINLFFYAIILQAILSWVQQSYTPIGYLLDKITAPITNPFRRIIPPLGGMDISPIPALILLQLTLILFIGPLFTLGWNMAFQ